MDRFLARFTSPAEGSSSFARIRSKVVLPIPFGPMIAILAWWGTLSEIPEKISVAPNDLARLTVVINDIIDQQAIRIADQFPGNLFVGKFVLSIFRMALFMHPLRG